MVQEPAAPLLAGYADLLEDLKTRIRHAQVRAVVSVNRELVLLYWDIGRQIFARQEKEGWGAKVIDRLAADLRKAFPEMSGFSPRNLKYMRAFADAYPDRQFVQEVLAQITWYHNITILDKLILCKSRNRVVVEYALRDSTRPLGVATYRLLPENLKANLPTPEQLEAELGHRESKKEKR